MQPQVRASQRAAHRSETHFSCLRKAQGTSLNQVDAVSGPMLEPLLAKKVSAASMTPWPAWPQPPCRCHTYLAARGTRAAVRPLLVHLLLRAPQTEELLSFKRSHPLLVVLQAWRQ